jgi:hypothetical protein
MIRPAPGVTIQVAGTYTDDGELLKKLKGRFGLKGKPFIVTQYYQGDIYRPLAEAVYAGGFDYDGDYDSIDHYLAGNGGEWRMSDDGQVTYTYSLVVTVTYGDKP